MVNSSEIASQLGLLHQGSNTKINGPASICPNRANTLLFATKYADETLQLLNTCLTSFAIVHPDYSGLLTIPHVLSKNPRLDFARTLNLFFVPIQVAKIASSASINATATIGKNVSIGEFCVIEEDVTIGDNTVLLHHVIVSKGCKIGSNCVVKSHTVIGQKGFGFERDDLGIPHVIPHFGSVTLGNHVEIGALNTVVTGTLNDTIIGDYVKTDDHVHIAHNVIIASGALITACSEISGSVHIGKNSWIGPNSSIINGVTIGDGSFLGIGSVVTKSVNADVVVAGNPAKKIRDI